jgi:DegV family protein with EDD domain
MRIKITADSTCDLSAALREQWNISVMPMHILMGDETYQDGVDISPKDIFENLQNGGKAHTSSAANGVEYGEFFAPFAQEYEAVIHISVGSKFSSCCQNANMAAQAFNNVYVIDSENICTGQGYLVLCAARWAAEGLPVRTICTRLQRLAKRVELSFVLDRLDCMAKSGRCSGVLAFGANLLKIKPCLEVIDGELKVTKKYRGSLVSSVERYARERLEGRTDIENDMVLISSCLPQEGCMEAARNAVEAYGFGQVYETDIGSTIGGHSGPGTIGIVFARKE